MYTRSIQAASLILIASAANAEMIWQRANAPVTNEWLFAVTWGNGQFVAVGSGDTALTSPDGINWSVHSTGLTSVNAHAADIVWNGSQYLAVGQDEAREGVALISVNGRNWVAHALVGSAANAVAWNPASSPGHYLALGDRTAGASIWSWFSLDGAIWLSRTILATTLSAEGVLWHNNQFVAVGAAGLIMTSPDGFTWTTQTSVTDSTLDDIAQGNGLYVAVGSGSGNDGAVLTSPDAVTWTPRTPSGGTCALSGVEWNGSIFVAVGAGGSPCIISSPDGITWHRQQVPSAQNLFDVTWNGTRWVAVGAIGEILYSDDTLPVELVSFTVE